MCFIFAFYQRMDCRKISFTTGGFLKRYFETSFELYGTVLYFSLDRDDSHLEFGYDGVETHSPIKTQSNGRETFS